MSKGPWLRVVVLVGVAGSAPFWTPRAFSMPYGWLHREPFYRGFPASYWKSELRDPGVHTGSATVDALLRRVLPLRTRDQVAMELARGGRRAVQVLIAALEDADEDTREGAARAILSMPPR